MRSANYPALCFVSLALTQTLYAQTSWLVEPVARSGDPVPGAPRLVYSNVGGQALDSTGGVSLGAQFSNPGSPTPAGTGCFYAASGQVTPALITGQPPAGLPPQALPYDQVGGCFAGLNGALSAWAHAPTDPFTAIGIVGLYSGPATQLEPILYHTGPAPGVPTAVVNFPALTNLPLVNATGQTAFHFGMNDSTMPNGVSYSTAIATGTPGDWSLVARTGFPVEGIPGASYTNLAIAGDLNLNDASQVAYRASFAGPTIKAGSAYLLWSPDGPAEIVVRTGDPAPTLQDGVTFAGFPPTETGLSDTGKVRFSAVVQGPGIDQSNDFGIWAGSPGGLQPVLREGQMTLGLEPGVVVHQPFLSRINNADQMALNGWVAGPGIDGANDQALWLGPLDAPEVVLREGQQAPGLEPGILILFGNEHDNSVAFPQFVLNDAADLLVLADIGGPGVTQANDAALFFRDGDTSAWSLVLRTGDSFDGRVIAPYASSGGFHGIRSPADGDKGATQQLLADGSFIVTLSFTDGTSGVYRFVVPEPPGALIMLAALFVQFGRRRSHIRESKTNVAGSASRARARGRAPRTSDRR